MESNEVLDKLPRHLVSLVIEQPYNSYTAQDHAIWRYVMRQNLKYLGKVAHPSYLEGLSRTGISTEQIPHMYGMNRILKEIGWAAVAVDGFIPPAAFMEFQAYHVLVIAADIRPIDQVEYTPAPDIIHEAAGHAPIIADPEYAQYLIRFGELGSKAFSSARDYQLYEAIRHLSIVKADPYSTQEEIARALAELNRLEQDPGKPSEMTLIRNLHWWTVEYGLIGDLKNPFIYGAGLLSSIGESLSALTPAVKKIPYDLQAMHTGFDITTKQPQLFVTPDFAHLSTVLEEFGQQMALNKGGIEGLSKAIESENTATCVLSSGIAISGTFTHFREKAGNPTYIKTTGPTALSVNNHQLEGHGKAYHADGFSTVTGKLKGISTPLENLSEGELHHLNILTGYVVKFEFDSGIQLEGVLEHILRHDGKNILMGFSDCTVKQDDEVLFHPSWGTFDLAIGEQVVSAYSGPADPDLFHHDFPVPVEKTHKITHTDEAMRIHSYYSQIRKIRDDKGPYDAVATLWQEAANTIGEEWLLLVEMLEILEKNQVFPEAATDIRNHLLGLKGRKQELDWLITNGLDNLLVS